MDREVVLGVEVEARHGVAVHTELHHVYELEAAGRFTAVPDAKILWLSPVEARGPGQSDGIVGSV